IPSCPWSSRRPMNGLTYFAPAFAARIAWFAEKIRVVLIRTPSFDRVLIAFSPSVVIWIFTTTFLWSFASCRPCLIISSASVVVTSRLIGPSTSAMISWITSPHFRPVFETRVGFVVTPSKTPHEAASRISSMFAVSRKIFTMWDRRDSRRPPAVKNVSDGGPAVAQALSLHSEIRLDDADRSEDQEEGGDATGDDSLSRPHLLHENHTGEEAHPNEAHRAGDEQCNHKEPATAEAVRRVTEAHPDRTGPPRTPVEHDEAHRGLTVRQAHLLRPGDLIHACGDEGRGGDEDQEAGEGTEEAEGHQAQQGEDPESAPHEKVREDEEGRGGEVCGLRRAPRFQAG